MYQQYQNDQIVAVPLQVSRCTDCERHFKCLHTRTLRRPQNANAMPHSSVKSLRLQVMRLGYLMASLLLPQRLTFTGEVRLLLLLGIRVLVPKRLDFVSEEELAWWQSEWLRSVSLL